MSEIKGNLALMPTVPIIPEVSKEKFTALSLSANGFLETAKKQGKITTAEQFEAVNTEVVRIKDYKKQVENLFKDSKTKAHEAHKSICGAEKKLLEPLEAAERQYNPLIVDYTREQERLRKEAEEKARQEAEAEAERQKVALMIEAETKMDSGASVAEITELINQAETMVPIYVSPVFSTPSKPVGLIIKENWQYEITDSNQIPREFMIPNHTMIGQTVKAMKGATKIAGVRVYDSGTVAKSR